MFVMWLSISVWSSKSYHRSVKLLPYIIHNYINHKYLSYVHFSVFPHIERQKEHGNYESLVLNHASLLSKAHVHKPLNQALTFKRAFEIEDGSEYYLKKCACSLSSVFHIYVQANLHRGLTKHLMWYWTVKWLQDCTFQQTKHIS